MFVDFFYQLRDARIPVTIREFLTFLEALEKGVARGNIDEFYYLSRAALVKDERWFDTFDLVFEFRMVKQPFRIAIVDDIDIFINRGERREAHPDAAGARGANPGLKRTCAVGAENGHRILDLKAAGDQRIGGAVAALRHLAVAILAARVDQAGALRIVAQAAFKIVDQAHKPSPQCPVARKGLNSY